MQSNSHDGGISIGEDLLSLPEAAKTLPRRRRGRKCNTSTLYRWTVTGLQGVILESIQVGGTRCTSRQALQRFFERLTNARPRTRRPASTANRQLADQRVSQRLDELGI